VIMKYKKLDEARIDDVTLSNEPLLQDEVWTKNIKDFYKK
jgi:hypothetical protein